MPKKVGQRVQTPDGKGKVTARRQVEGVWYLTVQLDSGGVWNGPEDWCS